MRGPLVLLGVILLYLIDPALSWAKKRFLDQTAPPFEPPARLYRRLAVAIPIATTVGCWALAYHRALPALGAIVPIGMSLVCARYFYDRARATRADFLGFTTQPEDPDYANDQQDLIVFLVSLVLVITPWAMIVWDKE